MKTIAVLGFVVLAVPALAQTQPEIKTSAKNDPNRVICRTEGATGSRLTQQKRCLTAQQWADQRQVDRQTVERAQSGRYKNGGQ